jgi:isoamylase
MSDEEWGLGWVRSIGVLLNGETIDEVDESGEPIKDDTFLIMLNCHHEPIQFYFPMPPGSDKWEVVIDTNDPNLAADSRFTEPGAAIELVPLSLVVCREPRAPSVSRLLTPERQ